MTLCCPWRPARDNRALILAKLDCLARSLTVQEAVLAKVWAAGGLVFAVDHGEVQPDDPDDPARTAFRQMMGVFAHPPSKWDDEGSACARALLSSLLSGLLSGLSFLAYADQLWSQRSSRYSFPQLGAPSEPRPSAQRTRALRKVS
jgi:hypothetical protein